MRQPLHPLSFKHSSERLDAWIIPRSRFAYELLKSYKDLSFSQGALIAVGFTVSFLAGLFVVRSLLDYVSHHGFKVFAWWRILVGIAGLIGLALIG